jgi:ABC-type sugar transport system ATPase subunit
VADRVVVLRQGRKVHDGPIERLSKTDLVHLMAGFALREEMSSFAPAPAAAQRMVAGAE